MNAVVWYVDGSQLVPGTAEAKLLLTENLEGLLPQFLSEIPLEKWICSAEPPVQVTIVGGLGDPVSLKAYASISANFSPYPYETRRVPCAAVVYKAGPSHKESRVYAVIIPNNGRKSLFESPSKPEERDVIQSAPDYVQFNWDWERGLLVEDSYGNTLTGANPIVPEWLLKGDLP